MRKDLNISLANAKWLIKNRWRKAISTHLASQIVWIMVCNHNLLSTIGLKILSQKNRIIMIWMHMRHINKIYVTNRPKRFFNLGVLIP